VCSASGDAPTFDDQKERAVQVLVGTGNLERGLPIPTGRRTCVTAALYGSRAAVAVALPTADEPLIIDDDFHSSVEEFTEEFLVVWPEDEERLNP
jgi:hypothetical protein